MAEFVANFQLNRSDNFNPTFTINATPDISGLVTKEELAEVNNRIDTMLDNVEGSELIGVERTNQSVTITSKTFVFEQGTPSTDWVINHNLNKMPSVILTNTNGERFEAFSEYPNENQVIIRLDNAATGFAYLN